MRFQKGNKYSQGGHKQPEREELRKAIREVESQDGRKPLLVHFVEQAYEKKEVLVAVMKKLLPDLRSTDANISVEDGSITFRVLLDGNKSRLPGKSKAKSGLEVPNAGKQR